MHGGPARTTVPGAGLLVSALSPVPGTAPPATVVFDVAELDLRAAHVPVLYGPGQHVLVSGPPTVSHVRAALTAGARGYLFPRPAGLPAPTCADPVPDAGTDPGPRWPHGTASVVPVETADGIGSHLSAREVQIVQLVADGRNNSEIGRVLGVSPLTVKSHLSRISGRLRVTDRAQIVLLALRARVIR